MQTFLPYPSIGESLNALDNKRLNKQILETYQILNILSGQSKSGAWRNHPAVLMWEGAESELYRYAMNAITIANHRGIKTDKNKSNIMSLVKKSASIWDDDIPLWRKSPSILKRVTTTHKANLYIKDPVFYAHFKSSVEDVNNKPCCDGCKYFWVTHTL